MKAIVCVDDRNGILFNKRRVSRDREVCHAIMELCAGGRLYMDGYSYLLFMPVAKEYSDRNMPMPEIICAEDFPDKAGAEDWCFMERCRMEPYIDRIESLVIYRWNRTYPSDFKLDIATDRWKTVHCREFRGYSHDRITEEIYENA